MMKFVRMLYPRNVMTFTKISAPRLQRKCARMFLAQSPNALQSTKRFVKGWISTLSQNAEMSSTRNARMNPKRTAHTRRLSVDQYLKPECRNVVHQECKDEPQED